MTTVSRSGLTMNTNAAPSSPTAAGQRRQIVEIVRGAAVDREVGMGVLLLFHTDIGFRP